MKPRFLGMSHLVRGGRAAGFPVAYRGEQTLCWEDFLARVAGTGGRLRVRPEHRWALCCTDAFDFACGFFALLHAGKQVVVPPNFLPGTLAELRGEFEALLAGGDSQSDLLFPSMAVQPGDGSGWLCNLDLPNLFMDLFTSGTSGVPKRVRKSAIQLANEVAVLERQWGAVAEGACFAATVPHHHIYGLLFRLLWPLCAGRPFDVAVCAQPDDLFQRLQLLGDAVLVSSPAQLSRLPELMELAQLRPRVRRVFSSGGPLVSASALEWRGALGFSPTEVYGSTETGGIAWREQTAEPEGDCWRALPEVKVELADDGALKVRSPFLGDDGWFVTADAAELVQGGRFRLKGRLDRVVKVEEKRLSLTQVEEQLRCHPWVRDAAALVLDGARRRAIGVAAVLSDAGRRTLEEEGRGAAVAGLKRHLADFHEPVLLPRHWRFVLALPYDERGKLTTAALTSLFGTPAK